MLVALFYVRGDQSMGSRLVAARRVSVGWYM